MLKVHVGNAGYFWGPGNMLEPYFGKVMGPVHIQFAEDVYMVLPELHMVDGTRKDPLLIIGARTPRLLGLSACGTLFDG